MFFDGNVLAFVGLGLMVGLSGLGSSIGAGSTGAAVVGLCRKRPEAFGNALVLACIPTTQALYGFVGFIVYQNTMGAGEVGIFEGSVVFGAGIALGLVCIFSAIYQSRTCAHGISAIASGVDALGKTLILAAIPEFFAILALVAAILLSQLIVS